MATSQIKVLLDELMKVLAEMGALEETAPEGEQMSEENVARMSELAERAEKLKGRVAFHERMDAKQKELRGILNKGAPAGKGRSGDPKDGEGDEGDKGEGEGKAERRKVFAIPRGEQRSKVFTGPDADENAFRAGMHLRAYVFGKADARQWCQDHEVRAQSGSVNALGGVLVAPEFGTEVIRLVEEYGVFPAEAKRRKMTSDQQFVPRRVGGLTAVPIGENDTPTESNITYNQVELVAKLWGIGNRVPNSLIEDSPISLADELAIETAYAFATAFDDAGFVGTGSPAFHGTTGIVTALGNLASAKGVVTAGTGRNTFDTLTLADFTNTMARLPTYARRNAKWYISPYGWAAGMARLMVTHNGNRKDDISGPLPDVFMGYPVRQVVSMIGDATGTAGKILALFGDLSQSSSFGDRRQISIKTSADRYMEYDQTFTFGTTRAAMVNHDIGTALVAGPIVALKAAA